MTFRRFELIDHDKNHQKFWEVSDPEGQGKGWIVTCRWGRIGTSGQERSFFFPDYGAADTFRCSKIDEKVGKGYLSIGNLIAKRAGLPPAQEPWSATEKAAVVARGIRAILTHCDVAGCDNPGKLCDCTSCEKKRTRVYVCDKHSGAEDARSCHHLARCNSVHAGPPESAAAQQPDPEDPFSLPFD